MEEVMKMKRCAMCQSEALECADVRHESVLGGLTFEKVLPAVRCTSCGEVYFAGPDLVAFEKQITRYLVKRGRRSADALRWLRKASSLSGRDFAERLQVQPETVSRWENGALEVPVPEHVIAMLLAARSVGESVDVEAALKAAGEEPTTETIDLSLAS